MFPDDKRATFDDVERLYGCRAYLKRGTSVCGNALRLQLSRVDDAVLKTIAGDVLRPRVIMAVIDGVLDQLSPGSCERELEESRAALRTVEQGIRNLAHAITVAGDLEPLLHELKNARTKRDELVATIAALERTDLRCDRAEIARKVKEHLDGWRALLTTKHVEDGRQLLREVLAGPLRFTPEGRSYRFEGEATFGAMRSGMADDATYLVAVRGFEPRSRG
jgi:hypothetical protein